MTKEDIMALMLHPIVRGAIQRQIDDALKASETQGRPKAKRPETKAPRGYLTYDQACAEFNVPSQTLRTYVHQGKIDGGGGLVRRTEMQRFVRRYTPRPKSRK